MPFYVNIRDVVGETWPSINKSTCTHDWMRCICSIGEREVVTHLAASPRHSAVSLCAYDIRWLILRWAPKRSVKYRSIILPKCVETFDKDKYLNRERRRNKNSVYIDPIPSILSSPIAREGLRFFFFFFFFSRAVQARGPSNHPSPSSRSSTYSLILFFFSFFLSISSFRLGSHSRSCWFLRPPCVVRGWLVSRQRLPDHHVEKRIDSRGMFRGGKSVVESILGENWGQEKRPSLLRINNNNSITLYCTSYRLSFLRSMGSESFEISSLRRR